MLRWLASRHITLHDTDSPSSCIHARTRFPPFNANHHLETAKQKVWSVFDTPEEQTWRAHETWKAKTGLCSVRDVVNGEWVLKKPLKSMQEMYERYNLTVGVQAVVMMLSDRLLTSRSDTQEDAHVYCEPLDTPPTFDEEGHKSWPQEAILRRTLAVASPEFVPASNAHGVGSSCEIARLDARTMMVRLLRSRLGLV